MTTLALLRSAVLPMLAATSLSACAAFVPKLETPKLSIVNVELVKSDLFEQRLRARIKVENPNDRELAVRGITYTIEVGGEEFGRGISGSSFTVQGCSTLFCSQTVRTKP